MTALAAIVGYGIGSLPTAGALGRLWGVDLRRQGSKNPGAKNALRVGGGGLASIVLLVEMSKGLFAVVLGAAMASEPGMVAAAVGAVAGNVYNAWYRLSGGKGLGITAGVLLGIWPTVLPAVLAVLVAVALATGSSGAAAVMAIGALNLLALVWWAFDWAGGWGIAPGPLLVLASLGIGVVLAPRHRREAHFRRPPPD